MSSSPSDPANKARGQVQVEPLLCKSCGLCAEYCPEHLMKAATDIPADDREGPTLNPSGHVVYLIHDPDGQCSGCGICATACPEGAVVVYRRAAFKSGAGPQRQPAAKEAGK
ncbi:MAG: hypothetical protein BIFFINMI_01641 [Phycisphaerae bacterium]|nr:hypothetical protein [Phycisphaerae bacterium]